MAHFNKLSTFCVNYGILYSLELRWLLTNRVHCRGGWAGVGGTGQQHWAQMMTIRAGPGETGHGGADTDGWGRSRGAALRSFRKSPPPPILWEHLAHINSLIVGTHSRHNDSFLSTKAWLTKRAAAAAGRSWLGPVCCGSEAGRQGRKERDGEPRIPYPGQNLRWNDMEGLNRNSTDREEGNRGGGGGWSGPRLLSASPWGAARSWTRLLFSHCGSEVRAVLLLWAWALISLPLSLAPCLLLHTVRLCLKTSHWLWRGGSRCFHSTRKGCTHWFVPQIHP